MPAAAAIVEPARTADLAAIEALMSALALPCVFFYRCVACGRLLRPLPGDCCVFCSYAAHR